MIALAGLDAETGVVMLLYLTLAHRAWKTEGRLRTRDDLREAIVEGAAHRIRPKLMTVLTMMIGLMPVLGSSGTGADVMKRIAAPMVGGLVTSFVLELLVYPAIFAIWKGRELPPVATSHPPPPPARESERGCACAHHRDSRDSAIPHERPAACSRSDDRSEPHHRPSRPRKTPAGSPWRTG